MGLDEVRKKINIIDDKMKNNFDDRLHCSKEVAKIKIRDKDQVYKPLREKEISERFSGESWYLPYIKKVMQISRKYQYSLFIEDNLEDDFYSFLGDNSDVIKEGGTLNLSLNADANGDNGLTVKDIISIVSDTQLNLLGIHTNETATKINISMSVSDNEAEKKEAFLVSYMLYKETIKM